MFEVLEILLKIVSYSLAIYGLWLLIGSPFLQNELEKGFKKWKRNRRLKRLNELNKTEDSKKSNTQNPIFQHLELLLNAISKKEEKANVFNFLFLIGVIFSVSITALMLSISDILFSLFTSIVFTSIPYIVIRLRLTTLRLRTQLAFLNEYHALLQNYQSTGRDIYYTIMNVIKDTEDRDLKKIYQKLLSSMQKERSEEAFVKAITVLSYSINSTHAKRFAKLLIKAQIDRADISLPLNDLNNDIKKRQKDMQVSKTDKLETIMMGYLPIALLPLIVFLAYRITGIRDFWHFFFEKTSFSIFIVAVSMSVISVLTAYITSKPRADI
ncbi:hypothetical protein [Robertmurraya massiliosenegalensis]|uniref:hypothetical protein n=1 Tax=Robertmurraya massiliosenegalensis TaxID=1287657 RepID=UPI000316E257|nr:hypothetical protein [Robertmurraya massiliosenegalensis]